jgi:urease accessory protein
MPPDDLRHATTWRASLALAFERRGERSVLASRTHDGPLVVQKALHPEGEGVCHAIVVHPPAGIAGGDELSLQVDVQAGAHALLTTPGAGKWYRTRGPRALQRVAIAAYGDACVEWLPQENIFFEGADARVEWEASLEQGARLIAWDIACLGRAASGEKFAAGRVHFEARIVRDGRLAWLDRGRIEPGGRVRAAQAGLAGASVFGTLVAAAAEIPDACLAECRAEKPARGEGAVTRLPGFLVARYRGDSSESARHYFTALWKRLRAPVLGREPVEPRIWST